MRILHVVPYVADQSDDQGRTDAVLSRCAELRLRGHDVQVLAGWRDVAGAPAYPQVMDGVPVHLFRTHPGPVTSRVLGQRILTGRVRAWLMRNAQTFDLVHLHLTRDPHLLAAAAPVRRAGVPYVVQLHGPLVEADGPVGRVRDRLRILPTLERASLLLAVDAAEGAVLTDVLRRNDPPLAHRDEVIGLLSEGVRLQPVPEDPPEDPPDDPLGGQPDGRPLDVVSAGRLGVDVQPMIFARAALALVERGVDATFTVLGPDGGGLATLREFIGDHPELDGRLRYDGAPGHRATRERLTRADLFVLPAVAGSRSPALLEALAAGVPSICTTDDRHAIALRSRRAARVVRPSASALAAAVADLAEDDSERTDLGRRGRTVAGLLFDIAAVADRLEEHYAEALLRAYPLPEDERAGAASPPVPGRSGATVIDLAVPRQNARSASDPPGEVSPADLSAEGGPDGEPALGADRLLWVAVEATAHRMALWREISRLTDLTVVLLEPEARGPGLRLAAAAEPFHLVHLKADRRTVVHGVPRYTAPRSLRTLVRRRPDAVVLDGWESPAFHAAARWARRAGVPVVASYGTAEPRTALATTGPSSVGRRSRSRGRLLRRADAVLAGGAESARAAMGLGVAADRITLAPNIPDLPPSEPRNGVVDVREGHRFLFVGPLIDRTNVIGLVHAFRLARGIGDVLTVAGIGPLAAELVATTEQLGLAEHVVLVPSADGGPARRHRERLLADAHTVVIPSTDEVWGHDVEEALAADRNVVVSTACAVSDAVAARADVFVADPSPAALARAMMSSRRYWSLVRVDQAVATIDLDDIEVGQVVSAGSRPGWD